MLSKKDLQAIRLIIQEELKELVMDEWVMSIGKNQDGTPEHTEKRKVNVLHETAKHIINNSAAIRGMQEALDHNKNNVAKLGNALLSFEKPLINLADAAQRLEMPEAELIEDKRPE